EASTGGLSPPTISTCTRSFGSGSARCTTTGTEDASSPFTTAGAFASVGASGATVSFSTCVGSVKTWLTLPTASVSVTAAVISPSGISLAGTWTTTGDWPPAATAVAEPPAPSVSVTLTTSVAFEVGGRSTSTGT